MESLGVNWNQLNLNYHERDMFIMQLMIAGHYINPSSIYTIYFLYVAEKINGITLV